MNKKKYTSERELDMRQALDDKRLPLAIGITQSKFVENIGGIIRTANAFLTSEIVLDQSVYNKYATAGAHKWENIIITDDVIKYLKEKEYVLIAMEQHERSKSLYKFEFPYKCAILIGHEVRGMTDELVEQCEHVIEIPQYGLVESLNVSTATSIVMHEYCRQHRK